MSQLDLILSKLNSIDSRLRKMEKETRGDQYIPASEVKKSFGWSEETLRKMRAAGKITDFKYTMTGNSPRKFRYSMRELEALQEKSKHS